MTLPTGMQLFSSPHHQWRVAAILVLSLALTGCGASSHPLALSPIPSLRNDQRVEFRVSDSLVTLRSVAVAGDSISGVPTASHDDCDSCRIAFPLADIQQPRVMSRGMTTIAMVVVVAVVGVIAWFVVTRPACDRSCQSS